MPEITASDEEIAAHHRRIADPDDSRVVQPDEMRAVLARLTAAEAEAARLREALVKLADHVDRSACRHEDTHRGGMIWTICSACGRKWADDEGGFAAYEEPPPLKNARAALDGQTGDREEGRDG